MILRRGVGLRFTLEGSPVLYPIVNGIRMAVQVPYNAAATTGYFAATTTVLDRQFRTSLYEAI